MNPTIIFIAAAILIVSTGLVFTKYLRTPHLAVVNVQGDLLFQGWGYYPNVDVKIGFLDPIENGPNGLVNGYYAKVGTVTTDQNGKYQQKVQIHRFVEPPPENLLAPTAIAFQVSTVAYKTTLSWWFI